MPGLLLILALLARAHAGPAVSVLFGLDTPLSQPTASMAGPDLSLIVGWALPSVGIQLQPELEFRNSWAVPIGVVLGGASATLGGTLRVGAYGHIGVPVHSGYLRPAADVGLLGQVDLFTHFVAGLRGGYAYAPVLRDGCETCEQPSDHVVLVLGELGLKF